ERLAPDERDGRHEERKARDFHSEPMPVHRTGGEQRPNPDRVMPEHRDHVRADRREGEDQRWQDPDRAHPVEDRSTRDRGAHPKAPSATSCAASVVSTAGKYTRGAIQLCPSGVGKSATGIPAASRADENWSYCTP